MFKLSTYASCKAWLTRFCNSILVSVSLPLFIGNETCCKLRYYFDFRWLFASGKRTEAKQVCALIAKRNNTKLEESIWKEAEKRSLINSEKKVYLIFGLFVVEI